MKVLLTTAVFLLVFGCEKQFQPVDQSPLATASVHNLASPVESLVPHAISGSKDPKIIEKRRLDGSKGVVVLSDDCKKPGDLIKIYNQNGSLWYEFTYYFDDSDGKFEFKNENFRPWSLHPDYFLLALRVTSETSDFFEVVVNEESGLKKLVKKDAKNLKFESWEKHILKTFAIEFDGKENPLRHSQNGKIESVDFLKIERFTAVKFEGEWLKLKWEIATSSKNDQKETDSGWIRWKDGDILLIDWFYFA